MVCGQSSTDAFFQTAASTSDYWKKQLLKLIFFICPADDEHRREQKLSKIPVRNKMKIEIVWQNPLVFLSDNVISNRDVMSSLQSKHQGQQRPSRFFFLKTKGHMPVKIAVNWDEFYDIFSIFSSLFPYSLVFCCFECYFHFFFVLPVND